jgi:Ca2+/Na+ antiporter
MTDGPVYEEKISSSRTEALFIGLAATFLVLSTWRMSVTGLDALGIVFLLFFVLFVFYCLNYRILIIRITQDSLKLKFGLFTWTTPPEDIGEIRPDDDIPALKKFGGAGIHFMFVRGRYRASFNFLEYPRVVVALKKKRGSVQDVSFSTRNPSHVIRLLRDAASARPAAL